MAAREGSHLDAWEEDLVLRVMDAAHRHADLLGASFAREAEWKVFDEEEAPRIARRSIEQFLAGQQEEMRAWNEKLRLFQGELNELSVLCLKAVEESAAELGDICSTAGRLDHFLVQTNAHMKQVALFLAGAGTGAIVAGGLFNLVALGSAAFLLATNPVALPPQRCWVWRPMRCKVSAVLKSARLHFWSANGKRAHSGQKRYAIFWRRNWNLPARN